MDFKTMLIVFAVLLFLLTLLASFGGSIKAGEPFYDSSLLKRSPFIDSMPPSHIPTHQNQQGDVYNEIPTEQIPLVFQNQQLESFRAPVEQKHHARPEQKHEQKHVQHFEQQEENLMEQFSNIEPFEKEGSSLYASY
jgi:hypothetical protein